MTAKHNPDWARSYTSILALDLAGSYTTTQLLKPDLNQIRFSTITRNKILAQI